MNIFELEQAKRLLRDYYNECQDVNEMLDADDVSVEEAESLMIDIDIKYALKFVSGNLTREDDHGEDRSAVQNEAA